MTVSATVIADSISPDGIRLTTMHLRYPRMIHSEFMTHRLFSRNGRSSRAVPVKTLLAEASYLPHFLANKPGMQATEELPKWKLKLLQWEWKALSWITKKFVGHWGKMGMHKQWANRPLEAFGYIDVLVSSTDWANFFALRDEQGAQPEIDQLAKAMKVALDNSVPAKCLPGSWHLPYIDFGRDGPEAVKYIKQKSMFSIEPNGDQIYEVLKKVSVARCARLSYKPFDGNGSIAKEVERFEKLMVSRPVHSSPSEHISTPDTKTNGEWDNPSQHRNYFGWRQYRAMIPYETIRDR